jgi:hypothetical protein
MIRHGSVNIVTIHAKFIAMPHLGERRGAVPARPDGAFAGFAPGARPVPVAFRCA